MRDLCGQFSRRVVCIGVALAAISLCGRWAEAQPYWVRAATRVQTGGFGISNPQYQDDNTGNVQAFTIATGPHTVTSSSPTGNHATATAYSLSELGALHGYGSISASTNDAPAGADSQITGASWGDTITAVSDTLATGSPVDLQATLTFHRTLVGSSSAVLVQANASMTGPFNLSISDTLASPNPTQSVTTTMTAYVGFPFLVQGQLYFQINGTSTGSAVSGSVDVANTASFTLVSLNPAASYTTASGVSYVPEPSVLSLAALAAAFFRLRRARRHG
jgi:hypothetical protein